MNLIHVSTTNRVLGDFQGVFDFYEVGFRGVILIWTAVEGWKKVKQYLVLFIGGKVLIQGVISNTITNPKEDLKGITTRSRNAYKGSTIPTTSSSPKVVERETEPVEAPVSALKPNSKPSIPYPGDFMTKSFTIRLMTKEKFFQIFQDLNFNISFVDALILMPKFGSTIKSLLTNKDKFFELARTPMNEYFLINLPEKLGDPRKFLIPCDFLRMDECLALADLGASINLMPLSVWNKLSLLKQSPTCMTLELVDQSISRPVGVAEDVFVKALIDVYKGELTLRVGNKAITFNLDQTSRYSANNVAESINRIDVLDVACKEYSKEVLGFYVRGNPSPSTKPIVSTFSPTLTPFGDSDFLLEETDAFLATEDEQISLEIDDSYYDSEGDILLLEEFLNDDSLSPPLPLQELKTFEPKNEKYYIDEPPVVVLKDLPPHLEYVFLEGNDKLPIIIGKYLKDEEKTALIKVLKSHKQAHAWKLFDIKGIDPEFCTHKILMKDEFKPAVQDQRRVNPKTHEVIKKEVLKLLDVGLITLSRIVIGYQSLVDYEKSHFMVKEGIVLGHKISKNRIEVDKAKVDVIAKLPHPTTVKGIHSFLDHVGFYRRFIQDFSKIAQPMTRLLMKDTPFFFSKDCIEAFQTVKKKLTKAPILVSPDWDLPFELMCDASDFAIEKELLAVVYAFEKLWPYLVLSKSIVYTYHSALKYLVNKQDAKPILLRWVLLLQEFDITVRDKKRSREPSHRPSVPIREPTPNITFGTTPSCLKSVQIKSSGGVFTAWKLLIFLRLATIDPPGDIMARTTSPKRCLTLVFIGPQSIVMPMTWSNIVTLVNVKEKFHNKMKCLKIPSKFARFLTYGASISWGRSYLHEGSTFKMPIGCTPYKLVYRKACHLPIELEHKAYWALKHCNYDLLTTGDHRKVQLYELNELRDQAYENSLIYKEKEKRIRDSKIKDRIFKVGDRVLLFNSRLKIFSGKLNTHWTGPFTIT
nr:reverse transcriptase domain-containing protein [Tanacetum cinerariifolium]